MRKLLPFVAVLLGLTSASSGPITQDPCPGGLADHALFAQVGNDILENLLFASDGGLYVSDGTAGAILRFAPDATRTTALPGIPSPGGLVQHPDDGLIYAGWGNSIGNALQQNGAARVVSFDPAAPASTLKIVAQGLNMPNGMTVLPNGDLVVSNDFDYGLMRVPRDGRAPTELAHVWGTNGLVVDPQGENLYAAITFDQRSPIARVPLNGSAPSIAVQTTVGVASLEPAVYPGPDLSRPLIGLKGLDDMTSTADGTLYMVANGMGELLSVNPITGAACLVAQGLRNPSSVRIAPESGPFADHDPATLDLYITEFSGAIRIVRFDPTAQDVY